MVEGKDVETIFGICKKCGTSILEGQLVKHRGELYHAWCVPTGEEDRIKDNSYSQ
jgi:hypothetical protein